MVRRSFGKSRSSIGCRGGGSGYNFLRRSQALDIIRQLSGNYYIIRARYIRPREFGAHCQRSHIDFGDIRNDRRMLDGQVVDINLIGGIETAQECDITPLTRIGSETHDMLHRRAVLPIGDGIDRHKRGDIIGVFHHTDNNGACLALERAIVAQRGPEMDLHIAEVGYVQHWRGGIRIVAGCDIRTAARRGLARKAQRITGTNIVGRSRGGLVAVDIRRGDRKARAVRPIGLLRHGGNLRQIEILGIRQRHDGLLIERENAPIAVLLLAERTHKSDIVGIAAQARQVGELLHTVDKDVFHNQSARLSRLDVDGIDIKRGLALGDNDLIMKRIVAGEPVERDGIFVHIGDRHVVRDGTFGLGTHHHAIEHDTTAHILAALETELIGGRHLRQVNRFFGPRLNRLRELLEQQPIRLLRGAIQHPQSIKIGRPFHLRMIVAQNGLIDRIQAQNRRDKTRAVALRLARNVSKRSTPRTRHHRARIGQEVAGLENPRLVADYILLRPSLGKAALEALRQDYGLRRKRDPCPKEHTQHEDLFFHTHIN